MLTPLAAAAALLLSIQASASSLRALSATAEDTTVITHPTAPAPAPPCFSAFNPDLETSCSRTVATDRLTNSPT